MLKFSGCSRLISGRSEMRRPPPPRQQQSSTLNTSAHSAETRADPFPCVAQASKRGDEQAQSRASRRRPWLDEKERVANTWAKSCAAGLYLKPRETRPKAGPVRAQCASESRCDCCQTDPETGVVPGGPGTAICVQDVDVQ